jgi:hypothetical protein
MVVVQGEGPYLVMAFLIAESQDGTGMALQERRVHMCVLVFLPFLIESFVFSYGGPP